MKDRFIQLWKINKAGMLLAAAAIALVVYGEVTATRLFDTNETEEWKPTGSGAAHRGVRFHHK